MNTNQFTRAVLLAIAAMGVCSAAAAEDAASQGKFGWIVKMDVEAGGDEIATVFYTNGRSQSINAGQGGTFAGGVHYQPAHSNFDFSLTGGMKFQMTAASNANINMRRFVVEARADYWFNDTYWIGAGPVFHSNIKYDGDGFTRNADFDDATGFTIKGGWKWVALSYTNIDYKIGGQKIKASNFGVSLIGRF